jgi:SAM-dependent methyltransferase
MDRPSSASLSIVTKASREQGLTQLRERWRAFAREDAREYARVGSGHADDAAFFASGAEDVAGILAFVGPVRRGHALDLGCGPGRLLPALGAEFERVDGVDIAPEMLEVAGSTSLPENVRLSVVSGSDLANIEEGAIDLVIALLVFQHVADDAVIASLLAEVRRVLRRDGRAFMQFDSRPASLAADAVQMLPDAVLPRIYRRHMRRKRRAPTSIDAMLSDARLRVMNEDGRGTGSHHLAVARA